ncbi:MULTISPECIES: glycoside hydrolase family 16 protein [Curtobacterium]|uniref:Glycoside hydrolase family 16 protein n=1 Tax=Curtobacterium citri TaxID=3055139 RepID=A0ABT7TAR4_9MICO|nr:MULTISPECIES: glycoside hydrolase family 16 protein [Curtobacterium]MDM7886673.1 glycoside hydrolase family 16 protein [Curtobacterium citri]
MQHEPGARHRLHTRRSVLRRGAVVAGLVGAAALTGTVAVVLPTSARRADQAEAERMPTGALEEDGVRWVPYLAQDFDRDAAHGQLLSVYPAMAQYTGIRDTSGKGLYHPDEVVSVHDSVLDLHLRSEGGQPLVATVLPAGYRSYTHQRVSIRYRADDVPGYKFVMLLWPLSGNWDEGEIDWPEGDLGGDVRPVSAVPGSLDHSTGKMTFLPEDAPTIPGGQEDWHVATMEWTAEAVRFWWDGELVASTTGAVPSTPMRVTLQAETTVDDRRVPADSAGHVLVDWVVAYRQAN